MKVDSDLRHRTSQKKEQVRKRGLPRLCTKTSLCNLCVLCVSVVDEFQAKRHHRDTEDTEVAQRISKNIEREKVNAGKVIDMLLHKAGWRWYTPFKTSGVLKLPVPLADGSIDR